MDGLINIYKEQDFTSFDVVAKLRGILHMRKIGHTGTLDPMAEGVLPVCVGSATKLCDMLTDHDKVYEAVMLLGVTYDTLDVTGNKLTEKSVMSTKEEVETAIKSFVGGYNQTPPMYSAKKVDGKKLYDLAREGKVIERKATFVEIYDIEIVDISLPRVTMRVHCGKGTYIRSLIDDIGVKLTCGAAMESLKRIRVGDFGIENAYKLSQIEEMVRDGVIDEKIIPVDAAFSDCVAIKLSSDLSRFVENGNVLTAEDFDRLEGFIEAEAIDGKRYRIYDCNGRFRAVYSYNGAKNELKPYKMFL